MAFLPRTTGTAQVIPIPDQLKSRARASSERAGPEGIKILGPSGSDGSLVLVGIVPSGEQCTPGSFGERGV